MPLLGPKNRGCFDGSTTTFLTLVTKFWRCREFPSEVAGPSIGVLLSSRIAGEDGSREGQFSLLTVAGWVRVRSS
jgi:hypothetical protein